MSNSTPSYSHRPARVTESLSPDVSNATADLDAYHDPVAELALKQLCTAVANLRATGIDQWLALLRRCLLRTPATTAFVSDSSGLLIADAGELESDVVEGAAAHLTQAMDRAAHTSLGAMDSITIRYRRIWLSGHRVPLADGTWQCLGFAGPLPVEPMLRPPECIGADVWAPFLQWSMGSQPSNASVLSDATGLLVGFAPEGFRETAENLAPHITLILERCDGALEGAGAPRFISSRFGDQWVSIVRVRLSRFRTLSLGVVGPTPVSESRSYDLKRVMRKVLKRKLVTAAT